MTLKPIKNIVGQAVHGENFFPRPHEIKKIWDAIDSGSHLLLCAPRRVGKTSILYHLNDNPSENYCPVYVITESVNHEDEFYKKLIEAACLSDAMGAFEKACYGCSEMIRSLVGKIKKFDVKLVGGLELNPESIDYKQAFIDLMRSIDLEGKKALVMVDEFPQTIDNIVNASDAKTAMKFLQGNREIRQDRTLEQKLQFVYTGSIGLEGIVSRINAMASIGDLNSVQINPLTREDAKILIARLLLYYKGLDETFLTLLHKKDRVDYLLDRIEWFIPYHIQLLVQELYHYYCDNKPSAISNELIDSAFNDMLAKRHAFEHWQSRLRKAFKQDEYRFAEALLNEIAQKTIVVSHEIVNLASKHNLEHSYKNIVHTLVYDGYINHNENPQIYRFNSPVLKAWWHRNVAT
jgi:hypothetical protein